MSSEDDSDVVQRHKGKPNTGLARARPQPAPTSTQAGARKQSKEALPQKLLQRTLSSSQQSKPASLKGAASTPAADEQDSDDDSHVLRRHQNKLQSKVC